MGDNAHCGFPAGPLGLNRVVHAEPDLGLLVHVRRIHGIGPASHDPNYCQQIEAGISARI